MAAAAKGKDAGGKVTVRQVKSTIGASPKQVANLKSIGLGKIGSESIRDVTPQLRGQLKIVSHLIETEESS